MRAILAALALLLLAAGAARAQAPVSRYVTASDGVRLHVLEAGQGPAVVLLHGATGSAEANYVRTGILQALAARHRVIALDWRGHGESQRPHSPRRYAADRFPRDVLEVMDQLGVERAHVAGYSLGGEMLAPLLALAPERLLSATFGGSGLLDPDPARDAAAAAKDAAGRDRDPPPLAARLWTGPDAEAMRAMFEGRRLQPPTTPPLDPARVGFPVLGIIGEYDRPHRLSTLLERTLPDFRLVVLKGRDHGTALADPAYRETLVEFINAHDP
ncbi:alpha/beta hydrolase [Phenylobacterium sp.]|jgi:pimeloyl-ACP methyl ester carboxylesterase|uniref:alpha/beta fold hydrolase n=1 Tax=Phenylobacterium sp. TaxID=1871053 RepID=UPI002F95C23C